MEGKLTMDSEVVAEQNPTPGEILREARIKKGLSQKHIAERIRIKAVWVQQIEEDDYSYAAAFIYLKGYLSAYAREVDVPAQHVLDAFAQMEYAKNLLPKSIPAVKAKRRKQVIRYTQSSGRRNSRLILRGGLLLLLAVAILLVVMWWEGEHRSLMTYFKPNTVLKIHQKNSASGKMALPTAGYTEHQQGLSAMSVGGAQHTRSKAVDSDTHS